MLAFVQILIVCILPYFLVRLSKVLNIQHIFSGVFLCYVVGMGINNFIPRIPIDDEISSLLTMVTVALAIPLILMNSDFKSFLKGSRMMLTSFGLALLSVFIVCIISVFIFESYTEHAAHISGMLTGVYTGGTPNMAAIQSAIQADENIYGALTVTDIITGGAYLIFLSTVGPAFFRKILPHRPQDIQEDHQEQVSEWHSLDWKKRITTLIPAIGLAILSIGVAAGVSYLFYGSLDDSLFIIMISICGIAISFLPFSQRLMGAYEAGDYLLLVFCLALGCLSNFEDMMEASSIVLIYTLVVMLGAVLLHILLARIFRIDADITFITSAACIYGPVFIGQLVGVMKNRKMLVPGMTMGIAGIALGSFLGIFIYHLSNWGLEMIR